MTQPSRNGQSLAQDLACWLGETIVVDTAGPMLYLGRLAGVTPNGLWLEDADVHSRADGHASHELYILEAKRLGVRVNRARVFVLRDVITSISALSEIPDV